MYNKKVIIDAIRNLNKSKPATKYNKAYTNNTTGSKKSDNVISAENGVNAPVFKSLSVGPSKIQGKGIFSQEPIAKDDVIGVSHIRKSFTKNGEQYQAPFPSVELGGYYNHSESPNIYEVDNGDHILMLAKRNINPGEELTSNYYNHNIKDLESPDNFKKGGSTNRPKIPNKKNSKAYSRSLEATNKFFAQNPLFSKPKSRKNKIFDPNAKYYADGGELIKAQNGLSHKERMQAYNDSLALYNSYNQFMNVLKNPQYKLTPTAIARYQSRNMGFGPNALPGNLYQNIKPVKVFTHYQGNQPWRVFKYKKPVNPIYEDLKVEPIELPIIDPPLLENKDLGELQVHDYNLPDSIEAPQYTLDPYTDKRLRLSVTPGKSRRVTKSGRLSGGQRYKHTEYKPTKDLEFGKKEVTKPIAALVQKLTGYDPKYFEGYEDEEGNFVPGELDYGNATGSEMEFRGAASLRDLMNQQKYKKEYEEYDKNLDTWLEQYEQSKKKQEQGQAFKKGGAKKKDLPKASFGLAGTGKDRSLTFTPFDFRSSYGQTSDFTRNPNYSLTYTAPNLFKKADLSANPLSFTLGRPYNTDAQSLTNRTLNFMPQEGLFSSYYDPALGGENNPKYQQYLQDVSNYTGTPVSELNQTIINQYNAAKSLAAAKPVYKKGIPLTANVGWDVFGNAFGDASSGPFTGYGSLNVGYAPEPGFYGTGDLGLMGVFGRRKNNAKISPQRYFDKGLTRQGDMAFIPKLNVLNFAVRQRPEYNDIQTQNILNAYANDIEQGTKTAQDLIANETDEARFDMSLLSPEITYQIKPFKDFPGVASFTGGIRGDLGGKDTMGDNIPITLKPYGNVRYTVPIEGAIDKLKDLNLPAIKRKKTYNDYANDQEYDEEYTDDTPEEDTPTENNFEINPPELQVNPNGTVLGRGDCPEGYERPCPKCKCQKLKQPAVYTDKRGKHLFDNMSFKDGGSIELTLSKKDIDKYVKGGYIVEDISVPTLTRKEGGWPPKSGSGLIKIAEKVPGLIDKLPTGWEKNIKKFTRSNYNPFSLLAKEIGYDIATQSHRAGRYDTDIINAIKGSEKYPASYFGTGVMHGQTVPRHIRQLYGEGKRDLNRNYFFGDETGFEPTFYDFESDAGLQEAIDWYGPLKAYELFSEIKGGEDLSIKSLLASIPDESKTSGPLVDLMQGYKNDNLLTSDQFKTIYDHTTGKLKLVDASPYSPSEFEGLIKDNLNYLFDQYGQETIPFQVNANTTKEGELPFGFHLRRNPINPYDDIQGHMDFFKRLSKDKFSTVARDLWGFNRKAYMDKYSYEKNLSPWMVDAMDAFGKPMVLTQENPIIFKQNGGAFEYEVGDVIELNDLSKKELEDLGYKLEEVK